MIRVNLLEQVKMIEYCISYLKISKMECIKILYHAMCSLKKITVIRTNEMFKFAAVTVVTSNMLV